MLDLKTMMLWEYFVHVIGASQAFFICQQILKVCLEHTDMTRRVVHPIKGFHGI
jgi:hypothetical protein